MSRLLRTLHLGFKSLLLHKLRTCLAMLGILIGVMAVIWLVALGEGVSYQAQKQIEELGATNVIVKSVRPPDSSSSDAGSFVISYGLTRADFDRISSTIPSVVRAVPMREIKSEVRTHGRLADVHVLGCTPEYFELNHLHMKRGRFIEDHDLKHLDNVCVIADETSRRLFPYQDPIGKTLEILFNNSKDVYRIVGQTKNRDPSAAIGGSLEGRNYNLDVYIPLATLRARIGDQIITARSGGRDGEDIQINQITLTAVDIAHVEELAEIVDRLLKKFHKSADYSITVPKELLRRAEMLRRLFNVLLVVIAGISLVVGGIGIMNIMLATVTERTREIGVRRAMGARRQDIIFHFLAETTVLSGIGGVLGVVFGFFCEPVVSFSRKFAKQNYLDVWNDLPPAIQNLEPRIADWSILAAFGISVFVGIVFGIYPAFRAAHMDPIEALRHE